METKQTHEAGNMSHRCYWLFINNPAALVNFNHVGKEKLTRRVTGLV